MESNSRSLWEIIKEVSEEEDPVRIAKLVDELTALLDRERRSGTDEAR